jgi:predicted thioesterase
MIRVPAGAAAELKLLVTGEYAVNFLGNDDARVLATPFLIGYLELAARDAVRDHLEPGYDTVGTRVDVRHLAATPLGMSVTFHAEVIGINERRVEYKVWAYDEKEKIAEGTHERFIINVERFGRRVLAKAKGE